MLAMHSKGNPRPTVVPYNLGRMLAQHIAAAIDVPVARCRVVKKGEDEFDKIKGSAPHTVVGKELFYVLSSLWCMR